MLPASRDDTRFADRSLFFGRWVTFIAMAVLVASSCLATALLIQFNVWLLSILLVLCVPALAWQIGWSWHLARLRRRLDASGYCLCPGCGYDLSSHSQLPSEVEGDREPLPCPECGRSYRLVRVREMWREWIDH